jgi:triacylglycerol lipase
MLARLQQATTLGLLIAAVAWALAFQAAKSPSWAWVGASLIVFGYALVLALEFALMHVVNRHDAAPRASTRQVVRAWWGEVLTAPKVFCWRQPFRWRAVPDWVPEGSTGGARGVVLVHGFVCNRGFWNPWMTNLRARGVAYIAVNLEPVFGSIDDYVPTIEQAVRKMEAATGCAPVLVAHSMGGLVVRAWLNQYGADRRVHRVITIGSPHRGTWLGRFAHTRNGRQMRLDHEWHQTLAAIEPKDRSGRFTCFYGNCDNIVFPASMATLPGADNRHVAGVAHVHLAFQGAVYEEVLRWVASGKTPTLL